MSSLFALDMHMLGAQPSLLRVGHVCAATDRARCSFVSYFLYINWPFCEPCPVSDSEEIIELTELAVISSGSPDLSTLSQRNNIFHVSIGLWETALCHLCV